MRKAKGAQLTDADRRELGKFGDFARLVKDGMGAHQAYAETYGEIIMDATQPIMRCPACTKEYDDFDGVGVVYCKPPEGCGFCRHVARSGKKRDGRTVMVCDCCGHVTGDEE